jgi:hypothetical protein
MEYLVDFDLDCDRSDAGIAPYIKAPKRKERRGAVPGRDSVNFWSDPVDEGANREKHVGLDRE